MSEVPLYGYRIHNVMRVSEKVYFNVVKTEQSQGKLLASSLHDVFLVLTALAVFALPPFPPAPTLCPLTLIQRRRPW